MLVKEEIGCMNKINVSDTRLGVLVAFLDLDLTGHIEPQFFEVTPNGKVTLSVVESNRVLPYEF